jgi:HD-GYP domain-containing protein (c-di-GMP phosphodiesterase class II)
VQNQLTRGRIDVPTNVISGSVFAIAIGRAMGLLREQIMVIASGAFLHDIGKIAVPDPIVLKQGVLAPDEAAVRQQHCWRGYAMLHQNPVPRRTR